MKQLGRYTLHSLLGKGGSAKVYEAELNGPAGFRKRVALKVVDDAMESDVRTDLVNEARLGALLRHPNVVDIYELGDADGRLYIAMELVEGLTMLQVVRRNGPPPGEIALELCRQITRGLIHAHGLKVDGRGANLIHRDLKLSNILMDPAGLAKISDFGIARAELVSDHQTAAGLVRGSLGYMSPEQMVGSPLDQRTDIFSLGVVFYQMVTGTRLIQAKTPKEYYIQLLDIEKRMREPAVIDPVRHAIPGMEELLFQMLRRNSERRIDSAVLVRKELNLLKAAPDQKMPMHQWLEHVFDSDDQTVNDAIPHFISHATTSNMPREALSTGVLASTSGPAIVFPQPTDEFIGREDLLRRLVEPFQAEQRVVCLKGAGGVGKTRLALEVATRLTDHLVGGAWYISLQSVSDREGLLTTIIEDLRLAISERELHDMEEAIASVWEVRSASLIIFDAAEGVAAILQDYLSHWSAKAPDIRWLVTTRRRIQPKSGMVAEVGPLSLTDAVKLYRKRAESVLPGVSTQTHQRKIRRMVEAVDRIPYGIELIAARAAETSPESVLEEVERSRSTSKSKLVEAIVGWSWRQLAPWERWALAQLSVFRGGFFIEQAEEVVHLSAWANAPWVVDVVGSLLEKSLLSTQTTSVGPRFTMYRMVREMAESALQGTRTDLQTLILAPGGSGKQPVDSRVVRELWQDKERVYARHAQLFARFGHKTHEQALHHHGGVELWSRHRLEGANIEVAFERSLDSGRSQDACNLLIAICILKRSTEEQRFTLGLIDRLMANAELSKSARARVLYHRANLMRGRGRLDLASQITKEVMKLAREIRSSSLHNEAKIILGSIYRDLGDLGAATKLCRSVLQTAIQRQKPILEVRARNTLALCLQNERRSEEALEEFKRALHRAMEMGDVFQQSQIQGNLAIACGHLGHEQESRKFFQASMETDRSLGQEGSAAVSLGNLGHLELALGHNELALELFLEARQIHSKMGNMVHLGHSLLGLGIVCMNLGRLQDSFEYLELACTTARQRRSLKDLAMFSWFEAHCCLLSGKVDRGVVVAEESIKHSKRLNWEQGHAMGLGVMGALEVERTNLSRARTLLDESLEVLDERHQDDHAILQSYFGRLALASGDVIEALAHYEQGLVHLRNSAWGKRTYVGLELDKLKMALDNQSSGPAVPGAT